MKCKIALAVLLFLLGAQASAQDEKKNLHVFGYFQAALGHQRDVTLLREVKSFTLQQLNLFLRKEVMENWSAFVNFEMVNSYSSQRGWGAFSLEEAWINYRRSDQFKLKLGLLTPTFNNLHEIKNRTPLLPYIIRPVVYESSFSEIVGVDEFAPHHAFVQAYGFIPMRDTKWDYALYLGNSPNINSDPRRGVTGVDTTRKFLVGGRVGVRHGFFKAGVSAAHDNFDTHALRDSLITRFPAFSFPADKFENTERLRLGVDLSFTSDRWLWEAEYIHVSYNFGAGPVDFDKRFAYGTLGYRFKDRLLTYVSYWDAHENQLPVRNEQAFQVKSFGFAYEANEMLVLKAQFASAHFDDAFYHEQRDFNYTYCAISVRF